MGFRQRAESFKKACRDGKGVFLFTGHFGNWEIGNAALAIPSKPPVFAARILYSHFPEEAFTWAWSTLGVGNYIGAGKPSSARLGEEILDTEKQ